MSGETPDDVVFHLSFQAEIFDHVAAISMSSEYRMRAKARVRELRRQIEAICCDPPAVAAE